MVKEASIEDEVFVEQVKNKIRSFFVEQNKISKRYKEVWLTVEDFGGLVDSDKFVINVKTAYKIESTLAEIKKLGASFFDGLSEEERSLFWNLKIYNSEERVRHNVEDIILFSTH